MRMGLFDGRNDLITALGTGAAIELGARVPAASPEHRARTVALAAGART